MRLLFVSIIVSLVLSIFPVMSQGSHNSCREGLVKISKQSGNDEIPLTSCVAPNMVERFSELGWQVVPQNSSVLAILFEKAKRCGETITEGIAQTNKCSAENGSCYFLQEPMLECLGEKATTVFEEVIGDVEIGVEKVGEMVGQTEE